MTILMSHFNLSSLFNNSINSINQSSLIMLIPEINDILIFTLFLKFWSIPKQINNKNIFLIWTYFFMHSSILTPRSSNAYFSLGESKSRLTLSNCLIDLISLISLFFISSSFFSSPFSPPFCPSPPLVNFFNAYGSFTCLFYYILILF